MSRTTAFASLVLAGCVTLAACSGDGDTGSTAPPPLSPAGGTPSQPTQETSAPTSPSTITSGEDPSNPATSATTSAPRSTLPPTTQSATTVSPAEPQRFLTEVPGTVAFELPPAGAGVDVAGEVYELIPGLFLLIPTGDSTVDANIEPPRSEDREILEAYARATAAEYALITQNPIAAVTPAVEWQASRSVDWDAEYSALVQRRIDSGQHLELRDGDLLRPIVIADLRTDDVAFLSDCTLVLSDWVTDATSETIPGESAGLEVIPLLVEMHLVDGEWQLYQRSGDARGCA